MPARPKRSSNTLNQKSKKPAKIPGTIEKPLLALTPPEERLPGTYAVNELKSNAAKKAMVYFRSLGYDLEECAIMSGYSLKSLALWQRDDPNFALDLAQAWAVYKGSLITRVTEKDPKYLLQNDFPERFKKDKEPEGPNQTQNNVFVGYDELAQRLAELLSGSSPRSDQSPAG